MNTMSFNSTDDLYRYKLSPNRRSMCMLRKIFAKSMAKGHGLQFNSQHNNHGTYQIMTTLYLTVEVLNV